MQSNGAAHFWFMLVRGKPTTTHEESDDDRRIQSQSFAPAYRGPQANPSGSAKYE